MENEKIHADALKGQQNDSDYNPDQFQNSRKFTITGGHTLKEVNIESKQMYIETDREFVGSVKELCWQRFGVVKMADEFTDEDYNRIHRRAEGYSEKNAINNTGLMCEDMMKFEYLTYDTAFFFFFMKVLFLCAVLTTFGFAIPALSSYGQGTRYSVDPLQECVTSLCKFVDRFSMYNQRDPENSFLRLELYGFLSIVVLQLVFFFSWQFNKDMRRVVKFEEWCSECSLLLRRLPDGECTEREVFKFIEKRYENENGSKEKQNPFGIKAVQIVYDFREEKQIIEEIVTHSKEIVGLLEEGDYNGTKVTFVLDYEKYQSNKQNIFDCYGKLADRKKKFLQNEDFRKSRALDSVFLHFDSREEKDECLKFLQKFYQTQWIISWGNFEPCQRLNKPVDANPNVLDNINLRVGLAPEPQNIIWSKVEHTYQEWKSKHAGCKIVMILVPLIHMTIIIVLQILKAHFREHQTQVSIYGSYACTVLVVIANQVLWVFLELAVGGQEQRLVTSYEVYKNYAGFAANSLSIIVAPVIVNYWFKGIYFGGKALAGTVFQYQQTALITIPFLMIISPAQLIKLILMKIRCIRNWLIRRNLLSADGKGMKNVYQFYEKPEFDISSTYAFLMANFLHATTFCHMVPAIIPLYGIQIIVLYWASKVRILKFCKYPRLIRRWLLGLVYANLMVSPLFFAGGFLLSEHVYKQTVNHIDHTPFILYFFFIWQGIFSLVALLIDKCLQGKNLFHCLTTQSTIKNLQDLERSRNRTFPTKSSSYFIGSNMLTLLGFEKTIIGTFRNKEAEELHRNLTERQFLPERKGRKAEQKRDLAKKQH